MVVPTLMEMELPCEKVDVTGLFYLVSGVNKAANEAKLTQVVIVV